MINKLVLTLFLLLSTFSHAQFAVFFGQNTRTLSGPQFVVGSNQAIFCSGASSCSVTATCVIGHSAVVIGLPYGVTSVTTAITHTGSTTLHAIYNAGTSTAQGTAVSNVLACNGVSDTYTIALTGGTANISALYFEISGATAFDTSNVCAGNNVGTLLPVCSVTTTTAEDFIYWLGLTANGAMSVEPSGYTAINLGAGLGADGWQKSSILGTNPANAVNSGLSGTYNTQVIMLAFK
jgi:hypothetical protein